MPRTVARRGRKRLQACSRVLKPWRNVALNRRAAASPHWEIRRQGAVMGAWPGCEATRRIQARMLG